MYVRGIAAQARVRASYAASSVCLPSLAIVPSRCVSRAGPVARGGLYARNCELTTVRLVGLNTYLVLMNGTSGTGRTGCAGRGDAMGRRGLGGLCCESGQGSSRVASGVVLNVVNAV